MPVTSSKGMIDYVPEAKPLPLLMRCARRLWIATAWLIAVEVFNQAIGPNGNNVNLAAWLFAGGLVFFVLGALTGGLRRRA